MSLTINVQDGADRLYSRRPVADLAAARFQVARLVVAGYRDLSVEVVDGGGDVVAYYADDQGSRWTYAADAVPGRTPILALFLDGPAHGELVVVRDEVADALSTDEGRIRVHRYRLDEDGVEPAGSDYCGAFHYRYEGVVADRALLVVAGATWATVGPPRE